MIFVAVPLPLPVLVPILVKLLLPVWLDKQALSYFLRDSWQSKLAKILVPSFQSYFITTTGGKLFSLSLSLFFASVFRLPAPEAVSELYN